MSHLLTTDYRLQLINTDHADKNKTNAVNREIEDYTCTDPLMSRHEQCLLF